MSWFIDVYSAAGAKLGPGPITSAAGWQHTSRMDRAGVFSFEMPAGDGQAGLIEPLRIVRCYAMVAGTWQEIGAGTVERIETQIDADGQVMLQISGPDLMGELTNTSPLQLYLDGSTSLPAGAVTHAQAVNGLKPVGWTFTADPTPPVNDLSGRWNYETTLQACVSLAAKCRNHFYLSGFRALTFASTFESSGVRAAQAPSSAPGVAAIGDLRRIEDASELISRVIAFGAGNADARLTTIPATRSTPTGYSTETFPLPWYKALVHPATESAYGYRLQIVQFKDISPISSTDADVQAAANMLFDQAYRYLAQRISPAEFYGLSVLECPVLLRPMQTIRVVFRDVAQNVAIDADLLILETTTTITADGPRTTNLVVSTIDRWPDGDSEAVVGRLTQAQLYEVAPQLNANSYVIPYAKPVDDAETAVFRFRFDSEVVQVTRVTFDFQLLPLESTVKSIGGSSTTSSADGAHAHTVADHTHTVTIGGHTHTVTIGNHDHSVTIGSHTHTTPNHTHSFRISGGSSPTYPIGFSAAGTSGGLYHNASGSDFDYPTRSGEGGATSSSGGGTTATSSSGGGTTATSSSGGGTTLSSSSGGGQTSSSGGSHTHTLTPTISTVYGIFRDSAANTFGLSDLEYSINGTTWYGFTVGVNGFTNLGDGWYRVDLTRLLQNSTTFRPLSSNNAVQVRRKAAGATKKAMIEAQLNVRTIIQAIAAL